MTSDDVDPLDALTETFREINRRVVAALESSTPAEQATRYAAAEEALLGTFEAGDSRCMWHHPMRPGSLHWRIAGEVPLDGLSAMLVEHGWNPPSWKTQRSGAEPEPLQTRRRAC